MKLKRTNLVSRIANSLSFLLRLSGWALACLGQGRRKTCPYYAYGSRTTHRP